MIYDHERDAEAERERSLPDWGGDDLFATIPRRRIKHTSSRPRRFSGPSTGAQAARRPELVPAAAVPAIAEGAHDGRVHGAEAARVAFPSRSAGRPASEAVVMPRPLPLPPEVAKAVAEEADPFASFVADLAPAAAHPASAPADTAPRPAARPPRRRRESPSIHERFTVRPDRIAGWAVGLGITLILIAVGTADGGAI